MDTITKIRVIITGATGMVGEGVLHECLQCPQVEQVLVVNRKPCGITHPKLVEVIHNDFFNLSSVKVICMVIMPAFSVWAFHP